MNRYDELKQSLLDKIVKKIDLSRSVEDTEVQEIIDDCVIDISRENYLNSKQKEKLAKELFFSIRKLDILQELIDDTSVTEIMVNGTNNIFVEKSGHLIKWVSHFKNQEKLEDVIQQIVANCNRVVNESSPIVDARLENGSRVHVVLPPVALNGPILTIRRFPETPISMLDLINYKSLDMAVAIFLEKLVKAGYNIFISGGTGSGKTTFLNALSHYIPKDERIITIEDSAELQIQGIPNLVRLETRNANVEGCKEISIRNLIKASLRMRPDRIIVGEVRGEEAIDMIQCLNTGHDGSLSTGHANSARDMLSRLETMILMGIDLPLPAIRRQIASGIDIIIHLGRCRDGSRKVLEIIEVIGFCENEIITEPLFEFEEETETIDHQIIGKLNKKKELKHTEKLISKGIQ